jgi:hypothetical protein
MDINNPINNATVTGNLNISGWALSGVGISDIAINIDYQYVGNANLGISTPALASKTNYMNNQNAGYICR